MLNNVIIFNAPYNRELENKMIENLKFMLKKLLISMKKS